MALELFVDTITTSISLRVKSKPVSPSYSYLHSSAFLSYNYEKTASYIANSLADKVPTEKTIFVPFEHYYDGLDSSIFIRNPNVLNITAINVGPFTNLTYKRNLLTFSQAYLDYKTQLNTTYTAYFPHNIRSGTDDLLVLSGSDTEDFNYNTNQDLIDVKEISFEEASNPDNGNGNNDGDYLKEFWA